MYSRVLMKLENVFDKSCVIRYFYISVMLLLVFSCTKIKENKPSYLAHEVLTDSIVIDEGYFAKFHMNFSLIDMKFFNDTTYLWAIAKKNDSYYLAKYSLGDEIKELAEYCFSQEMQSVFDKENCEKLLVINLDSLMISTDLGFYFYSISSDTIYNEVKWEDYYYFSTLHTSYYYDESKNKIYGNFSDTRADYIEDVKAKKKIIRFAQYDLSSGEIEKITVSIDDIKTLFNANLRHDFVYANELLISKASFQSEFQIYNTIDKTYTILEKPCLKKMIDDSDFQDEKTHSYQNFKNNYMESYIQQGMCYDYKTERMALIFLNPVPERDENGLKPEFNFRSKSFFIFDKECNTLGLIETKPDGFLPSFSFFINGSIYLISVYNNEISLYTVKYELE